MDATGTLEWGDFQIEAGNWLSAAVYEHSQNRFQQWNDVVHSVKGVVGPIVDLKLELLLRDPAAALYFEDPVELAIIQGAILSDILSAAMESEYADIVAPGFYTGWIRWYQAGHFPACWEEPYPEGRAIIY